eukprot:scaffold16790_cov204-Skeletonema_marinoi.AAC.8
MELSQLDREIEELVARAKTEIEEYNTACKKYINAFTLAFDDGDIHKQPRHPFLPSTQKLEAAVSKRKATFIEKTQVDDRVKTLKLAELEDRVPKKVMKMNEQSFHQAVDIAKSQFSASCGAWLNHVKDLLANAPSDNERASAMTDKQAKHPPTPTSNNRQLPSRKTISDESGRLSLKRPLDSQLSRGQRETTSETITEMIPREDKKQKKDAHPIVLGHRPQFDLPSVNDIYRMPYERDNEMRDTRGSDIVQDPDSDEVSIAEVLTHMGR